jgi:transposase-like protein/DNA-binding winged helix-turn-helix (wHTH) protein
MKKYSEEFRHQAIKRALKNGIMPTAKELKISRNTLKKWLRQRKSRRKFFKKHQKLCVSAEMEKSVVYLKERRPEITLRNIQRIIKQEKGQSLSINGIHKILQKYGTAGRSFFPLTAQNTPEIQKGTRLARILLEEGNIKQAAGVLNFLPMLPDFSILKKIPSQLLSLRRRVEQLEVLWSTLPMAERYKKVRELRKQCEKEKLFFTGMFVVSLEMNALNFFGHSAKVFSLYKRYGKYLTGLPLALKYTFLMECFICATDIPEKYPQELLKKFPYNLERFVARLPEGAHRIPWYETLSACFQIIGELERSLKWMEKLFQELPREDKKRYLPQYLFILATKGAYSKVLGFEEPFTGISTSSSLLVYLSKSYTLLSTGKPKEALDLSLTAFSQAEKEHLRPIMAGFTFFISCCYAALKEAKKAKQYLKMAFHFAGEIAGIRKVCSLLLGLTIGADQLPDAHIRLVKFYLLACKTLRRKDYLKTYRFAEKKGLMGFFHRVILLHPEAVIALLKKGKETHLPKEFLSLPVFKEQIPIFKLFLLRDKETIFYGDRKIAISPQTKDFQLLLYLFLNRRKFLDKGQLFNIFYKHTLNPARCLTKALSNIRGSLGLTKGTLTLRKAGVLFNAEARVDLEEFEERYKMGRISKRVGETRHALSEYLSCFNLYGKSPFEQMGYYYNFAEERRTVARNMFENLCNTLIKDAKKKGESKTVRKIREKFKREGLFYYSVQG